MTRAIGRLWMIMVVCLAGCAQYPTRAILATRDLAGDMFVVSAGMSDADLVARLGIPDQVGAGRHMRYDYLFGPSVPQHEYTEEWTWVRKAGLVVVYLEAHEVVAVGELPLRDYRGW